MNRIILLSVDDAWIKRSGETAGASGSAGAVTLRMTFDSAWDGTSKTVYFTDALGENSVKVLLGLDALVSDNTYDVPVPGEAMTQPGQATVTVVGESEGRVITTQAARFRVLDAAIPPSAGNSQPVTPDEAAQLQAQIDALEEIFVTNRQQAQDAAQQAESAKDAVQEAIDNIPPGAVLVINDLTTGGTSVALSAEQGKKLDETKADRQLSNLDTPQAALANLGAGVRPSLAINGDFRHPVNQRGKTVYTEAGPCIDMCTLDPTTGAVKLEILDGFIRLTQTNPGATRDQAMSIAIPKENFYPGETVTVSALVRGTGNTQILCLANNNIVPESIVFKGNTPDWDIITSTFSLPDDLGDSPVRIYMYADTSGANGYTDFMAAKPEEGSTQTLAYKKSDGTWELLPQPENDYATQLLKCQWHKMVMGNETNYSPIGVGQARSESLVVISVPTPTTLRIRPTVVLDGQVNVRNAETAVTSTEVSVDVEGSNCVLLNAVVTGAVTGAAYDAFLPPGSFLILDCSL